MIDDVSSKSLEILDEETESEQIRKVEAALFIAGKFLSVPELVALTDVNPIILKKILGDLQDSYQDKGMTVVNQNDLWKMDVASEYAHLVNKLASGDSEFSKAEQETLAIIAYKQPIKQSVVIKIRGNKAYDHVKQFVEMGLINKKRIGHTAELSLSDRFHEYFKVPAGTLRSEDLEKSSNFSVSKGTVDKSGESVMGGV